jgi:RNA polymerase sigma-70 factor, ECF subfamily
VGAGGRAVACPTEAALLEYIGRAQGAWPQLDVDVVEFVRYVAERSSDGLPPPAHAADLWLAHACSRGSERAIEEFRSLYLPVMARVLSHRRAAEDAADDVRQLVQQKLLVGDVAQGVAPKIASYRGKGPLRSWVASATATTLMMLRRAAGRRREVAAEPSEPALAVQLDPELDYLKQRYTAEVEAAIVQSLNDLSDRQRTLLRLHLGEAMTIDVLGPIYGVSRSTAARWLTEARNALRAKVRDRLQAQLRLTASECDSLVALVNSRLDISLVRRLTEPGVS